MTETAFYILLSLLEPRHGYGIIQHVQSITNGRITLGAGTVYGTLKKLQKAELIKLIADTTDKKVYQVTTAGYQQLKAEQQRLQELLHNAEVLNDVENA
ncbi:PadR family transcriptional regulator [Lactiplantibacillus mudanjiangensis]|uniref:PadR family transcriptional regulator [Lactobacillus paracollinoides] n=1 Tax=Lactiplantibacillus mudanjiangensis TaxID=1296538 RepID=A0A660E4X2_9LACO|nr:PadR family transcriptional regulator [Lactiplantibacillus mudanjiangensis]VDG20464.1 PadR family transcriptional regulator [Lactobacillus paracollinoides] [Lactiplantibacillus mudanjiangensis]VDG24310.1 PadR family transcriptional regulator [Lactobacillus paracollinoides] [Lactiplantibacillus mudanjiangensis]VDG30428.1 PadR family transcriptional regulator [Lactobacillus paracollinoides] [Lactiplantibacillus mudanjiangensis]VDG30790.1 PadR family transcriptional regulator [Lactobacillus par